MAGNSIDVECILYKFVTVFCKLLDLRLGSIGKLHVGKL